MSVKLVVKIADSGTIYYDPAKGDHASLTGHMWWELHDSSGQVTSYGFAPDPDHQGQPFAPGFLYRDDNVRYEFDTSKGDYQREFEITDDQFVKLQEFGTNPFDKFDSTYNGLKNSCIDFTWQALAIAGLIKTSDDGKFFQGDLIPTWNIDNIEKIGLTQTFQTKTLAELGMDIEEYQTFISDYYGLKILNSSSLENFLTKYNFNQSLSDYAGIIPSLIINDGNGGNFNLAAFPNFSDLVGIERTTAWDNFTNFRN